MQQYQSLPVSATVQVDFERPPCTYLLRFLYHEGSMWCPLVQGSVPPNLPLNDTTHLRYRAITKNNDAMQFYTQTCMSCMGTGGSFTQLSNHSFFTDTWSVNLRVRFLTFSTSVDINRSASLSRGHCACETNLNLHQVITTVSIWCVLIWYSNIPGTLMLVLMSWITRFKVVKVMIGRNLNVCGNIPVYDHPYQLSMLRFQSTVDYSYCFRLGWWPVL